MDEALEEEHGSAGQPVAQLWIHGIGRDVSLIGVQADYGFPLAAELLLTEGDKGPGPATARLAGPDD